LLYGGGDGDTVGAGRVSFCEATYMNETKRESIDESKKILRGDFG